MSGRIAPLILCVILFPFCVVLFLGELAALLSLLLVGAAHLGRDPPRASADRCVVMSTAPPRTTFLSVQGRKRMSFLHKLPAEARFP